MKRGILYTITTILLILSLFALSRGFAESGQLISASRVLLSDGYTFRILQDDIVGNSFSDMVMVSLVEVDRSVVDTSITFRQDGLGLYDFVTIVGDYSTFVMTNYTPSSNFRIVLSGFDNSMDIWPYGSVYTINNNGLSIVSTPGDINQILVNATISLPSGFVGPNSTPSADAASNPLVDVYFYDQNGKQIYHEARTLSATQNNGNRQFYMEFVDPDTTAYVGNINVAFGTVNATSGKLGIFTDGIVANVTKLTMSYVPSYDTVYLQNGILSITSLIGKQNATYPFIVSQE